MTLETAETFYRDALRLLDEADVPCLVGGGFAFRVYAGIERPTKDLDLFLRAADRDRALAAFAAVGCQTEVKYLHWLAKAFHGDAYVDLIHDAGNGLVPVDDDWFAHAEPAEMFGLLVRLIPPEEMVWHKAFTMERDRYDGGDIAHVLLARGDTFDWPRLLERFGPHWRVLLGHLIQFGFVYPRERDRAPEWVIEELLGRLRDEIDADRLDGRLCRGPLLSGTDYLIDTDAWGYRDARLQPFGTMTAEELAHWREAIRRGT